MYVYTGAAAAAVKPAAGGFSFGGAKTATTTATSAAKPGMCACMNMCARTFVRTYVCVYVDGWMADGYKD